MRVGAVIVTTGLRNFPGVTSLLLSAGNTTAGQRMISSFQCCNVRQICLVTEKENNKAQRQFAQDGVIFLHTKNETSSVMEAAALGLSYMQNKFDRVFLTTGDYPLFLPETLHALLQSSADISVPIYSQMNGCPILLTSRAIEYFLNSPFSLSLEETIAESTVPKAFIQANDPGILVQGLNDANRQALIQKQSRQLLRPVADVTLQIGSFFFDTKLAMLLHMIEETHSVRHASQRMQISYSSAWAMLNEADSSLDRSLVLRQRGGPGGSSCQLSETGQLLLQAYDRYRETIQQNANNLFWEIFGELLE